MVISLERVIREVTKKWKKFLPSIFSFLLAPFKQILMLANLLLTSKSDLIGAKFVSNEAFQIYFAGNFQSLG